MPKVQYTAAKGLYQESGKGLVSTHQLVPNLSNAVTVTTGTTMGATHYGHPVIVTGTTTITLPAVAVGISLHIINGNADGTAITVSPNVSDKFLIDEAGAAGTDNKDIVNTAVTARYGDYVKLTYGTADGWTILELGGTWVDEA
jgi:hypothetical protein